MSVAEIVAEIKAAASTPETGFLVVDCLVSAFLGGRRSLISYGFEDGTVGFYSAWLGVVFSDRSSCSFGLGLIDGSATFCDFFCAGPSASKKFFLSTFSSLLPAGASSLAVYCCWCIGSIITTFSSSASYTTSTAAATTVGILRGSAAGCCLEAVVIAASSFNVRASFAASAKGINYC